MQETDWEKRYQTSDMPWEKGEPSPGLVDFLAAHPKLDRNSVCVPGCGLGHDAREWAKAKFQVTGFDLAPSAVRLATEQSTGLPVEFKCGNFLSDAPTKQFDWIFEHTLFCAINPDRRDDYVKAILRWLKPDGHYLAVNYMIPDTDGPPFGTTRDEQIIRFSPHLELLEEWVPRSYANRANLERIFWWKRKR